MSESGEQAKPLRQRLFGDVLAVLGFGWPLVTLATMLLYAHFDPTTGPQASLGASRDLWSKVLASGSLVAGVGPIASRRRTLQVLALFGVCVNLSLAMSLAVVRF